MFRVDFNNEIMKETNFRLMRQLALPDITSSTFFMVNVPNTDLIPPWMIASLYLSLPSFRFFHSVWWLMRRCESVYSVHVWIVCSIRIVVSSVDTSLMFSLYSDPTFCISNGKKWARLRFLLIRSSLFRISSFSNTVNRLFSSWKVVFHWKSNRTRRARMLLVKLG